MTVFFSINRILLLSVLLALPSWASAALQTAKADGSGAALHWMGRDIAIFYAPLASLSPDARVLRAVSQLDRIDTLHREMRVTQVAFQAGDIKGVAFHLGEYPLFNLLEGDIDPLSQDDLPTAAGKVQTSIEDALGAWRALTNPELMLKGLAWTFSSLLLVVLVATALWRLRRLATGRVYRFVESLLPKGRGWIGTLSHVMERLAQLSIAMIVIGLCYLWIVFSLHQFPVSAPYGMQLSQFLVTLAISFGRALLGSIPSLVTLMVIGLMTRAAVRTVDAIFDAAQNGNISLPGLHVETLSATRNISIVLVWALGLTFAYPYIPGSHSMVFQGLSVLFGFMITLGSSGIASHLMSGITLVYSRAVRRGDLIQTGSITGVVREIGALSTKILNQYNEEITIPNAVFIASPIHNYSREDERAGVMIGSKVTIGYDAPWRQIHGLLMEAAVATPGLRKTPAPFVLQRALDDFYVEYELMVTLANSRERFKVQSALHANIQDAFNAAGVQIMSPHFLDQPSQPVLSPREQWFASATDSGEAT